MDCIVRWVSESDRTKLLSPYDFLLFYFNDFTEKQLIYVLITAIQKVIQFYIFMCVYQFSSVAQSCPTLCDPMDCSTPGLPVHHQLPEFTKLMSIESVMPSNHLILCRPLLLLPSVFPTIRVFSNESVLCIRWPKYWSFSFNISPAN